MEIIRTLLFVAAAIAICLGGFIIFFEQDPFRRRHGWSIMGLGAAAVCLGFLLNVVFIPRIEKAQAEQAALEQRVFTADVITVKEKYISAGNIFTNGEPFIVITDGEDVVKIKVTDGIFEKYKPGDVYEHDADPVQYNTDSASHG